MMMMVDNTLEKEDDNVAFKLAGIVVDDIRFGKLPAEVVSKAELFLLNGLGCLVAGRATEIGRGINFDESLTGKEKRWVETVKPTPEQYKMYRDASGTFSTELTTVCLAGINHPDSVVVPVLLNMGQKESSREAIVEALVAGTEVMAKIGILLNPSLYYKGWHSTGVCGIFGAAAVACKLLQKTKEETANAFQLAAGLASSDFYRLDKKYPVIKVANPGIASVAGVSAATQEQQKNCGAELKRTSVDDFVGTFRDGNNNSQSIDWTRYDILELFFKSMPVVCAFHAILEPLHDLLAKNQIDAADIAKIKVGYHKIPSDYYSGHTARSVYGAQTSLPYSVAILAKTHHAGIETFTKDVLKDKDVQRIADSVEIVPSERKGTDDLIAGEIELVLAGGEKYSGKVDKALGCSPKDVPAKFFQLARFGGLNEEAARRVYRKIADKEYDLEDLRI
ncbi:uncharacterized protein involved in propionate catabolism [Candidatus Nitrososphaera evergladensis SR1]|uniref:Uncharacterized protein involved in propionate catabolism n=1 Tax=Candidatus Nitrososphaera evergladensis SR1 TaxID=1459636 RepID=A0A075MQV8_9ARCH|nr:MmgE/PrpD family protein [Candidatus Nitrososphaera evergladensis]AIF83593.1 uncharacterized protein involved in propionate catabolism [Candidatus Nitrososphaera evergladensis SR1]